MLLKIIQMYVDENWPSILLLQTISIILIGDKTSTNVTVVSCKNCGEFQ